MHVVGQLAGLAVLIILITAAFSITLYIISALGLMTLANRRGIPNGWLGFIPIGSMYIFGSIADDVNLKTTGRQTYFRFYALGAAALNFFIGRDWSIFNRTYYDYGDIIYSSGWRIIFTYGALALYLVIFYMIVKDYKPESAITYTVISGALGLITGGAGVYLFFLFALRNRTPISLQNGNPGYRGGPGSGNGNPYGGTYTPPPPPPPQPPYTPPPPPQPPQPPQSPPEGYDPTSAAPYNPSNEEQNTDQNNQEQQ